MKQGKLTRSLLAACSTVALAAVLYGCVHSDDDPTTTPPDPATVDLSAVPDHNLMAGEHVIEPGESLVEGNVEFSCPADGEACVVTVAVDADGKISANSTGGAASVLYSMAYLDDRMAGIRMASDRALGIASAITSATSTPPAIDVEVTATRATGEEASVEVAVTGDDAGTGDFEAADAPAAIAGWHGSSWMRGEATEHVTVYTDIDEPTPTAFTMIHLLDRSTDDDASDNEALSITNANVNMVSGVAEFPSAALQTGVPFDEDDEFTGMFDGAPGTFTCAAADCTLSTDGDGKLASVAGIWYFTPDEGAKVPVADDDYLHFGWWLNSPDEANDDGEYEYMLDTFYGGSTAPFTGDEVAVVEGKAKYSGAAAGLYATRTFEDGDATGANDGTFTADVALTAAFGGDDVAINDQFKISGSVTNFMEGGESLGWSVALQEVDISGTGGGDAYLIEGDASAFSGTGAPGTGSWEAMFYGPVDGVAAPTGVAGQFGANLGDTDLAGAFGATKD